MNIQYLIHADCELPGIIRTWAKNNHHKERFCHPYAGDALPTPSDFDLLIIMGGPQDLLNMSSSPYLYDEIALIRNCMREKRPILGICLGAQLLGEACGAKTERSPHKEIGVFPIELTNEGMHDPLLKGLPAKLPVIHWHNDMPGITSTSVVLASSEGCPRQIIRYAPLAYGFQCHPEPTKQNIETMIQHFPNDLVAGKFVQTKEAFLAADFKSINDTMIHILDNLSAMM